MDFFSAGVALASVLSLAAALPLVRRPNASRVASMPRHRRDGATVAGQVALVSTSSDPQMAESAPDGHFAFETCAGCVKLHFKTVFAVRRLPHRLSGGSATLPVTRT